MADWWEAAPLAEFPKAAAPAAGGNWWDAAPLANAPAAPKTNVIEQGGAGLSDGIAWMAGLPADAIRAMWNSDAAKLRAHGVEDAQDMGAPFGGSESIRSGIDAMVGEAPQPQTGGQRIARRVGQEVGAGAVAAPLTGPVTAGALALNTASSAMSGLAGGTAAEMGASPLVQTAASLLAGGGTAMAGAKAMDRASQAARAAASVPTVDKLKADASALYKDAEINGITASQPQTDALKNDVRSVATRAGLISPTGRLSTAYPKVSDALAMVDDYAKGTMTPTQMLEVRSLLQGAAQSADTKEARIGSMMIQKFDDFTSGLAPQFKDANDLWSKAKKGEKIDQMIDLAGLRAGQFSGSGYENALRTEFRAYARQIVKGQVKGLSKAEITAINKVANGGPLENLLRDLGKAAPRGVVGTGISGGIPFMVGNAVGGPVVGAGAAGAVLTAGEAGRRAATSMQSNNALLASALARTGGAPIPYASGADMLTRRTFNALAGAQAARITSGE